MENEVRQPELGLSKLRVSIVEGILEIEGNEDFVLQIYEDFKQYAVKDRRHSYDAKTEQPNSNAASDGIATQKTHRPKSSAGEPRFLKDLDLATRNGNPSLRDYYGKFAPKLHSERNLIFVAYLQDIAEVTPISVDHVYSCYRKVQARAPKRFRQSLIDTSNKKGWLSTESLEDIRVSIAGLEYLEHDMPRVD